jgi:hypothetical protein
MTTHAYKRLTVADCICGASFPTFDKLKAHVRALTGARLTRRPDGSYASHDGRWTVEPATMGAGVTGWAGGRGWSNGRREWRVTDTTGQAHLSAYGDPHTIVLDALWRARDIIAAHS